MLRNCEGTIQRGLNKSYTDSLYNYLLGDCDQINFAERWGQIKYTVGNANNTSMSGLQDESQNNSIILDDSMQDEAYTARNFVLKRQEGREYEITMTLLESYRYIDFAIEQGRIKISNFLRLFFKMYEKELAKYFLRVIEKTKKEAKAENANGTGDSILSNLDSVSYTHLTLPTKA